jgi:raffinose/stachyose/melibiose transport system substrate-binding protein
MKANVQPNPMDYDFGGGAAFFGQGKAAMAVHGDWILQTALNADPKLKMGIVGVPYDENPNDPRVIIGVADGIGVIKSSKHLKEAIDFFDYYTSVASAQIVSKYSHSFAPQKGFDTSGLHPIYSDIMKLISAGQGIGWEWQKLNPVVVSECDKSVQAYLSGSISKKQVLDNVESMLAQAR